MQNSSIEKGWWRGQLLLGLLLFSAIALFAAPPAAAQTPVPTPDKLSFDFSFRAPLLKEIEVEGSSYTSIASFDALTTALEAGDPALPIHFVKVLIPPGKEVQSVSVNGILKDHALEGLDLIASPIFPYQNPCPIGSALPAGLVVNDETYALAQAFPAADYRGERVGYCRGYTIYSVGLNLIKYLPAEGKISWYSDITLTLNLRESSSDNSFLRPDNREDAAWVKNLVCNPEMIASYEALKTRGRDYPGGLCDPADAYDFVIITTETNGLDYWATSPSLPYNWDSLIAKHLNDDALTGIVVTEQAIMAMADYENPNPLFNDQPARMREFCKDAYQDWGTSYILVGADAEWIPARQLHYAYEGNVDSDIYWNHLDNNFNADGDNLWGESGDSGFDLYAEMYIGRLTCDVPQDVSNWMTKSFVYVDSQNPDYLDNAAFYGGVTGWPCQGDDFVDYSAIYGVDHWLGPNPYNNDPPYPTWLGFQYGFETWNLENASAAYNMTEAYTEEPPNAGWNGAGEAGLRAAINLDQCTLIAAIAHANENMSMDVYYSAWESNYHNTLPFFVHDYGCHCGDMDAANDGVLHSMLFHSDTELAFACVYNTGYGWGNYYNSGSSSALQQKSFFDYLFDVTNNSGSVDNWQQGKAMAYARDLMAPLIDEDPGSGTWRGVIECCLLFGDPAQKIRPPAEPELYMSFPAGLPDGAHPPGLAYTLTVSIEAGKENYVPGSGYMHYRFDPASAFTQVSLTPLGNDLFEVVLPNTAPGCEPEFYFSAQGDLGTMIYSPWDAPTSTYGFDVYFVEEMLHDDFEDDLGWTVVDQNVTTGTWERCVPNLTSGGQVAPTEDNEAGEGTYCFVTENGPPNGSYSDYDIDGGPTILTSPTIDLSSGDAQIASYNWYYSRDGDDNYKIDVSNDNGTTWTNVYSSSSSLTGWAEIVFTVGDYVTPTSQVKVRFSAQDQPNNDIVEAGLDDFRVQRLNFNPELWADAYDLSVANGCAVDFQLDAGATYAGRNYLMLASLEGSSPGMNINGVHIPLNWDWVSDYIYNNLSKPVFQDFWSTLDAQGQAVADFDLASAPGLAPYVGQTLTFAFAVTGPVDFASNAISVEVLP